MRKRTQAILAAAAAASVFPAVSNAAVTLAITLDPTFYYGTANGAITTPVVDDTSGTAVDTYNTQTKTLYLTAGQAFVYGYDALFTPGTSQGDTATGLYSANFGVNDSSLGTGYFYSTAPGTTGSALNGNNKPVTEIPGGSVLTPGGSTNGGIGTSLPLNATGPGPGYVAPPTGPGTTFATGTATQILSNLEVDTTGTSGTFTLTPSSPSSVKTNDAFVYTSPSPTSETTFASSDVTNVSNAVLTVITTGGTVTAGHAIISLTHGSTPTTNYPGADGTITMVPLGSGGYAVKTAQSFTTATTGSVSVGAFANGDTEIYALKLSNNSAGMVATYNAQGGLTNTIIQTVINDINGSGNNTASNVTASAITGVYQSLFPASSGYDLLLTAPAFAINPPGNDELGFDFSANADPTVAAITVTGVAAVPEPATAAGIVLGAAGLLLGRRRNKSVVA